MILKLVVALFFSGLFLVVSILCTRNAHWRLTRIVTYFFSVVWAIATGFLMVKLVQALL
jgi:predicted RND superfamily exporter protein